MKSRAFALTLLVTAGLVAAIAVRLRAQPPAAGQPAPADAARRGPRIQGAGGCAAAG